MGIQGKGGIDKLLISSLLVRRKQEKLRNWNIKIPNLGMRFVVKFYLMCYLVGSEVTKCSIKVCICSGSSTLNHVLLIGMIQGDYDNI